VGKYTNAIKRTHNNENEKEEKTKNYNYIYDLNAELIKTIFFSFFS